MGKNPDNWFKMEPQSYISDTRHLTETGRFIYTEVIFHLRMMEKPLPDDERWLSHAFHTDRRKLRRGLDELIADGKLLRTPDGIINPRCMADIAARQHQREVNTETARARVAKRRGAGGAVDAASTVLGHCVDAAPTASEPRSAKIPSDINGCAEISFELRTGEEEKKIIDSAVSTPCIPLAGDHAQPKKAKARKPRQKADPYDVHKAFERYCEFARNNGKTAPKLNDLLRAQIGARLVDHGLDGWGRALAVVEGSQFLMGERPGGDGTLFPITLVWLSGRKNFQKVVEGSYAQDRKSRGLLGLSESDWDFSVGAQVAACKDWPRDGKMGAPPNASGCRVPRCVLDKHRAEEVYASDGSGRFVGLRRAQLPSANGFTGATHPAPEAHQ